MTNPDPRTYEGTSARPSAFASRMAATIAVLLGLFFLSGWFGYRAYLESPVVVSAEPAPAKHAATAERAVLFVVDAFTPARAFDPAVMPTLARLAGDGASGIVQTGPVTTTAPCVYSLTTGRPGNLVQAIFNFHSSETRVDSLLSTMVDAGGRIALAGDPAWHRQFGWIVPHADRHESPEPGITIEHHIDAWDAEAVDFVLAKYRDPKYRLLILHLGSVDAVGHMVTPLSPRYTEQLTFIDGLVSRTEAAIDLRTTLLLVTGDHGMASRGTHGGEEEARLTPYVMVGPGVQPGVRRDLPQTALTSTLSALLGLPFLPVSEHPPATELLARAPEEARALVQAYFTGKRTAAATQTADALPTGVDAAANATLNEALFGAEQSRVGFRALAALFTLFGLLGSAFALWRSAPRQVARPPMPVHLTLAAAAPFLIALAAAGFIWMRGAFAFRSTSIATAIVAAVLATVALIAWALTRFPNLSARLATWRLSVFVPALVVLTAPLVNSHWLRPRPYFELLLLGSVVLLVPLAGMKRRWAQLPAVTAAAIYVPQLSVGDWQASLLPLLAIGVACVTLRNLQGRHGAVTLFARLLVVASFVAAFAWRAAPSTHLASIVLSLFFVGLLLAMMLRDDPIAAAGALIGSSTALFLIMASDTHESVVFCVAALIALALSRLRVDLSRPGLVYVLAAALILLRVCLYFELGDQYNISSIRTAPGFLLADYGLPLASVVGLLLLKYCLPWLVILAMTLRTLSEAPRPWVTHLFDLLVVGYVVRFAAVAAVVDPFRALPNGMDGIVGMFCVTWVELLTFGLVATLASTLIEGREVRSAARPVPATA